MTPVEIDELLSVLELLGSSYDDLTQRVVALENSLSPADREKCRTHLSKLKSRGQLTNASIAIGVLREKLLPKK